MEKSKKPRLSARVGAGTEVLCDKGKLAWLEELWLGTEGGRGGPVEQLPWKTHSTLKMYNES